VRRRVLFEEEVLLIMAMTKTCPKELGKNW
jgi:hypothetical protein